MVTKAAGLTSACDCETPSPGAILTFHSAHPPTPAAGWAWLGHLLHNLPVGDVCAAQGCHRVVIVR